MLSSALANGEEILTCSSSEEPHSILKRNRRCPGDGTACFSRRGAPSYCSNPCRTLGNCAEGLLQTTVCRACVCGFTGVRTLRCFSDNIGAMIRGQPENIKFKRAIGRGAGKGDFNRKSDEDCLNSKSSGCCHFIQSERSARSGSILRTSNCCTGACPLDSLTDFHYWMDSAVTTVAQ
jgi:hypothetical protein